MFTYVVVAEKSSVRLRARPNWAKAVKDENGQETYLGNPVSAPEGPLWLSSVNKTKPNPISDALAQDLSSIYPAKLETSANILQNGRCEYGTQRARTALLHLRKRQLRAALTPARDSQSNGADALEETLSRLSKKPGVKATIALDRASGTILKTAGHISSLRTSSSQQQDSQPTAAATANSLSASTTDVPASSGSAAAAGTGSETQGAEEMASMVWAFVNSAGGLVHGLDTEVVTTMPWSGDVHSTNSQTRMS